MLAYTYISPGKFELIDKPKIGLQGLHKIYSKREKVSAFSLFVFEIIANFVENKF